MKNENKLEETQINSIPETNTAFELISSVFKENSKKIEIIEKLRPFFTLKVIPQREIEKVYSAVEKISPEKIDLIEEFKYEEDKFDSNNLFETKSKSIGLSNFDLDLSINIFGQKQSGVFSNRDEKSDSYSKTNSKIHCIHSIVISLFRILIDFKDIKFTKQVYEELNGIENANITERKILLEKLVDKFGLYVPLELLIGGRINMSFDANNEDEKRQYHSILQKKFKAELGGGIFQISAKAKMDYNKNNTKENISESLGKIENLSKKIEGGDYMYKDDLKNWIKSFNINNLQIIEYKTLIPIYCFIPGLESKLTICLQKYEDIVLQEIYNLIESEFKSKENNLYEGSPVNTNIWKVGITEEIYKSFIICKRQITTKLIISKNENNNKKEDIICGEVPDGFIIVGWKLKTNSFSKPYDLDCKWEKQKDFNIIGSDCFKFKVTASEKNKEFKEDIEVEWKLEIFCIKYNFLIPYTNRFSGDFDYNKWSAHYFVNCICFQLYNSDKNDGECFYNKENKKKIEKLTEKYEEKLSKNLSLISLEDCKNNKKLYKDLKEVEYFTKKGFLNSFKLIKGNDFFDLNGYIKAPDNSLYKNGIFHFNIISQFDEKEKILFYKGIIKTKIYHINSFENGSISSTYFARDIFNGKQNLLGALFAIFQYFNFLNPDSPCNSEYANIFRFNHSLFIQNCNEWKEKYALKSFPKNVEYLFEYEDYTNKNNDEIQVLCSIGRYIEISKEKFNLDEVFKILGISNFTKWSFIVGNNIYFKKDDINEKIIGEIKNLGKLIICQCSRC